MNLKTDTLIIAEAAAEAEAVPGAGIEVVAPGDPFGEESVDRARVTLSSSLAPMVLTYLTLSQLTEALRRADFGVLAFDGTKSKLCRHYWIAEAVIASNPALPGTQLVGLKVACPECFPLKPEGGKFAPAHITRRRTL